MTYNTTTKPHAKQLPFGAYKFVEQNGRTTIASEFNTRITYERANGRIDKWRTARSFLRYEFYQRTSAIRHYIGLSRLLRNFPIQ